MRRVEFVGRRSERTCRERAMALLLVSLGIVGYLWCASMEVRPVPIIANLHDVVIILRLLRFFQWSSRCRCCCGASGAGLIR